ncbi:Cytosolic sulfotransferase 16 [Linum perenne]
MLKTDEDIKKLVSTLPTTPDGNSNTNLYQYQGFWYHALLLFGLVISTQTHFNPNPNTTILCTYPKTGTTWLKALSFAISNRTHNHKNPSQSPFLIVLPHNCILFVELLDCNQNHPNQATFHLHHVRLWHFRQKQKEATWVIDSMGIEDGFNQFCLGFSIEV